MAQPNAKLGDTGKGNCLAGHPDVKKGVPKPYITTYVEGCDTVFLNNQPLVTISHQGKTDCGHTTTCVAGSDNVFAEHQPVHRIGDDDKINEGDGDDVCVSGSDNVDSGG